MSNFKTRHAHPTPYHTHGMTPHHTIQHHTTPHMRFEYSDELSYGLKLQIFPRGLLLKPFPNKGNCKATVIIARWPPLALQNRRPLTDLVLSSIWVSIATLHTTSLARNGGCAGLISNDSTRGQVIRSSRSIFPGFQIIHVSKKRR